MLSTEVPAAKRQKSSAAAEQGAGSSGTAAAAATDSPSVTFLINAGMRGFLAGEMDKPYAPGSAQAAKGKEISPRTHLQTIGTVVGPVEHLDGGKKKLGMTDYTRCVPNSVVAHRRAIAPLSGPIILCGLGPGVENTILSYQGRYQEPGQDSAAHEFRCGPLAQHPAWSRLPDGDGAAAIGCVAGLIFITPLVTTKHHAAGDAPGDIAAAHRQAPLLSLAVGTRILMLTGGRDDSKNPQNVARLRDTIAQMPCKDTVTLHVVEGAGHNPFESKPTKLMAQKNCETTAIIEKFVQDCCYA
jgi:hypothetical protein